MMRTSVIAAACVSIVIGSPALSQDTIAPPRTFISAEFGAQGMLSDLTKQQEGMYTQYRAKPGVVTLRHLTAQFTPEKSPVSYLLNGTNIGYNDMGLAARATSVGLWDAQFRYDRSPHTYSGQYNTLFNRADNTWALSSRPATAAAWNTAAGAADRTFTDPIRNQWDNAKLSFRFTPTEDLDSRIDYGMIKKSGERSTSMAWASPGGNSIEAMVPIDNTTHDFRITQAYGKKNYQLQASYNLSSYSNSTTSIYVDNQTQATDVVGMTSRGRQSDMPNNTMHAFNLGGAWSLPFKTRLNGAYTWSVWDQNAAFLPTVNNSAVTNVPANPASLEGKAGTKVFSLEASSKPFDNLMDGMFKGVGLSAKLRRFEFRDETGVDAVYAYISDAGTPTQHQVERSPFRREEREVSAKWAGRLPVAVGLDYTYEMLQANPEHANIFKTLETGPRVTFDFHGVDWMNFRMRYSTVQRRAEAFSVDGVYKGTWNGFSEYDNFRNPLYADRDRTRLMSILTIYPVDKITLTGTFENGQDKYKANDQDVTFGYQKYNTSMYGFDLDYAPIARLSLNAGYSLDKYDDQMQSRYRTPTGGLTSVANWVWTSQNNDEMSTYYLGATGTILPGKVDGGIRFEHALSKYLVTAQNPNGAPLATIGSASDRANATAADYPEITQKLEPMNLWVSYKLTSEWSTTLRFQNEKYDQNDYRTAFSGPIPAAAYRPLIANSTSTTSTAPSHIFLGNQYPSYNAQLLTITMTYRPNFLRFGRSAL